jgi:hypothetical protein
MNYISSWALFPTEKEDYVGDFNDDDDDVPAAPRFTPYAHSGKRFNFDSHEKKALDGLRQWARSYFGKYNVINTDMYIPLSKAAAQGDKDFDLLAKVTKLFNKDAHTNELRLKDASGDTWFLSLSKTKYPEVHEDDVVRVRSAVHDKSAFKSNTLSLNVYSNVMPLISSSKLGKELKTKVKSDDSKVNKSLLSDKDFVKAPVLASEVSGKNRDLPVTSLDHVFGSNSEKNLYRCRFFVVKFDPSDSREIVQSYDAKSQET